MYNFEENVTPNVDPQLTVSLPLHHLLTTQFDDEEILSLILPIIDFSTIEEIKTLRDNLSKLKHPIQSYISQTQPKQLPKNCNFTF